MAALVALYDACVLHAEPLRDFLVQLAMTDVVRAHWTEEIHREWQESVLRRRPDIDPAKVKRVRELMDLANPDGLVADYERLIDTLLLPDADDRHVLAAAVHCGASFIVTANLRDFPTSVTRPHGIIAIHPDDFLAMVSQLAPRDVIETARFCRARRRRPPSNPAEYVELLGLQGMTNTATFLSEHLEEI